MVSVGWVVEKVEEEGKHVGRTGKGAPENYLRKEVEKVKSLKRRVIEAGADQEVIGWRV